MQWVSRVAEPSTTMEKGLLNFVSKTAGNGWYVSVVPRQRHPQTETQGGRGWEIWGKKVAGSEKTK